MYVLDTNIISEMRKLKTDKIDAKVAHWLSNVDIDQLFVSAITLMELEIGVLSLERRDALQGARLRVWLHTNVVAAFAGRTLPFTVEVAWAAARLNVPDRRSLNDSIIAATAIVHRMTVVTRNVVDFTATGVAIVNPWQAA